ncbi:hypothetical protein [Sphingomonas sp. SRS2]|uniref:hypothetical protein n=1 Tax=Sphingomonas sp. SRS2 TaxID=133190 RepID=UPI00128E2802|nr:hypothetical protein [Sphingomonas sp. SRS2]
MTQRPTRWRRQPRTASSRQRRRKSGGIPGGQLIMLLIALGVILFMGLGEPLQTLDHVLAMFGFMDEAP